MYHVQLDNVYKLRCNDLLLQSVEDTNIM